MQVTVQKHHIAVGLVLIYAEANSLATLVVDAVTRHLTQADYGTLVGLVALALALLVLLGGGTLTPGSALSVDGQNVPLAPAPPAAEAEPKAAS